MQFFSHNSIIFSNYELEKLGDMQSSEFNGNPCVTNSNFFEGFRDVKYPQNTIKTNKYWLLKGLKVLD